MSVEHAILEQVRTLPAEKKAPPRSAEGLWAEFDIDISAEDIKELRREMW